MIKLNNDQLSKKVISEYWEAFISGSTWNFFSSMLRNQINEPWATREDWFEHAKACVENDTNITQALEILLVEDKEEYLDFAQRIVSEWHERGAHDAYYYYELMAKLPCDNTFRRKYLSSDFFVDFTKNDEWGESDSARKALINVDDQHFLEFLAEFINKSLSVVNISDDEIEYNVLPLLIDLGRKSGDLVSKDNLDRVKRFCLDYLKKDEVIFNRYLDGCLDEDERQIWVGDNIAYYAWVLGWDDIILELKNSEWYWMSLFSEWWDDTSNNNLLVWSLCKNEDFLKKRAAYVMKHDEYCKLDGAIAWERFRRMDDEKT